MSCLRKAICEKAEKWAKTCSNHCGRILYYREHPNTKDYMKICPICNKSFNAKRGGHYNDAVYCSKNVKIYQVRLFGSTTDKPIGLLSGLK